jgi:hypothetical protein
MSKNTNQDQPDFAAEEEAKERARQDRSVNRTFVALGVDGDGQMWHADFGMSHQYHIYDRDGNPVETRANPYAARPHHGNPELIVDLLPECGVFIGRRMGKPDRLKDMDVEPVFTDEKDPKLALAAYLKAAGAL